MTAHATAVAANPWLAQGALICGIDRELDDVLIYHLELTDSARRGAFHFRPGQFNMLYVPGVGEAAISISGSQDGLLEHTVREVGNVTQALARLAIGDTIGLRGPYGSAWPMDACRGQDVIVIAGGIGLAPLRPVVLALLANPGDYGHVTLLYGTRTPDSLLFASQYAAWASAGCELHTTVDRWSSGWAGNVGVVPLLLDRQQLAAERTHVLVCGPEVMIRYTVRSALQRGIAKQRIWISMERNMQCAVGLCGHCQLGPTFVCKDGPVYRYDVIEPFLRVEGL